MCWVQKSVWPNKREKWRHVTDVQYWCQQGMILFYFLHLFLHNKREDYSNCYVFLITLTFSQLKYTTNPMYVLNSHVFWKSQNVPGSINSKLKLNKRWKVNV